MGEQKGRGWRVQPKLPRVGALTYRMLNRLEGMMTPDGRITSAERQIQLHSRKSGVDGALAAHSRERLASYLEDADRWVEARVLREEVLNARRRNLGHDELFTLSAEIHLAVNLCHFGLYADALPLAIHARDAFRKLGETDKADRADEWVTFIRSSGDLEAD